ncbi:hypothetical protein FRB99_006036 [Tulasnella sp. 403]|nr:hypothetical protein FRB99_006036 [Tulasnella sp. 403]
MVNWKDQSVLAADQGKLDILILALLGLYAWEMLVTMRYDITIFTGKRPFKYPMGVYLACRYALLFSLIGVTISMNATKEIDCQSLYVFNQLMGNITIGASSSLLMLRTIAIWNRRLLVFVPLIILSLGQWSILLHGVITVEAKWNPQGGVCYFSNTKQVFIDFIYIYTMVFDLTVLTISTVGLVKSSGRSDLWKLLFQDGIAYFVVAFTANCAATVRSHSETAARSLPNLTFHLRIGYVTPEPQCRA